MLIKTKRVYDPRETEDGYRILVDRLWPRGIKKEELKLDEWAKHLAPSTELRKWFNHQPERFDQFSEKYHTELHQQHQELLRIKKISKTQTITLLYSSRNLHFNQTTILLDYLQSM